MYRRGDNAENFTLVTATTGNVSMGSGPSLPTGDYWAFGCMTIDVKSSSTAKGGIDYGGASLIHSCVTVRACELAVASLGPVFGVDSAHMIIGGS